MCVLSPRPWVKHERKRKRGNFEELFLILTSKRIKVATEDTWGVSVESQDFGVSNQGGYAAHFSGPACDLRKTFQNFSRRDLEKYQSAAKTHRFSALVSCCWGSDYTVTYNLLVSTLCLAPRTPLKASCSSTLLSAVELIWISHRLGPQHSDIKHISQILRYFSLSKQPGSATLTCKSETL